MVAIVVLRMFQEAYSDDLKTGMGPPGSGPIRRRNNRYILQQDGKESPH